MCVQSARPGLRIECPANLNPTATTQLVGEFFQRSPRNQRACLLGTEKQYDAIVIELRHGEAPAPGRCSQFLTGVGGGTHGAFDTAICPVAGHADIQPGLAGRAEGVAVYRSVLSTA